MLLIQALLMMGCDNQTGRLYAQCKCKCLSVCLSVSTVKEGGAGHHCGAQESLLNLHGLQQMQFAYLHVLLILAHDSFLSTSVMFGCKLQVIWDQ